MKSNIQMTLALVIVAGISSISTSVATFAGAQKSSSASPLSGTSWQFP